MWTATRKTANDTLIPDLVSIKDGRFIIFDAKYYNTQLKIGAAPIGQSGIESVKKQYLYQLAYQKFIKDHGFSSVSNCFLMPTENDEIEDHGEASMSMLLMLGLQNIKVRFLPARLVYDLYLSEKKTDASQLKL